MTTSGQPNSSKIKAFTMTASFTRPNDSIQYSIGDRYADITTTPVTTLELLPVDDDINVENGQRLIMNRFKIHIATTTEQSPQFTLFVFSSNDLTPTVVTVADNREFDYGFSDAPKILDTIDVTDTQKSTPANYIAFTRSVNSRYDLAATGNRIFVIPILLDAYTPDPDEIMTITASGYKL